MLSRACFPRGDDLLSIEHVTEMACREQSIGLSVSIRYTCSHHRISLPIPVYIPWVLGIPSITQQTVPVLSWFVIDKDENHGLQILLTNANCSLRAPLAASFLCSNAKLWRHCVFPEDWVYTFCAPKRHFSRCHNRDCPLNCPINNIKFLWWLMAICNVTYQYSPWSVLIPHCPGCIGYPTLLYILPNSMLRPT